MSVVNMSNHMIVEKQGKSQVYLLCPKAGADLCFTLICGIYYCGIPNRSRMFQRPNSTFQRNHFTYLKISIT